jgi:ArsR family transcriptional regulator
MQPLHRLFKALADSTRLRILNLLLEEPLCVCELEFILDLPQPLLSRHLAYLRAAGIVVDKRQGMRVQYSLASGNELLGILESCLKRALSLEETYREDRNRRDRMRTACCASSASGTAAVSETNQCQQGDVQ